MEKKVKIDDIAALAGVAKSTVSRFLNGGSVSENTKLKIEQFIAQTGFTPNQSAQNLKSKQSKLVGVVIPRIDSYAVSRTLMGLDDALAKYDMQMLVLNCSQSSEREISALDNLSKQKLAGVIWLASKFTPAHTKAIEGLQRSNIPLLIVGQTHPNLPFIAYPDYQAAYTLAHYCTELGHHNAVFIGVDTSDVAVGYNRWQGYLAAYQSIGKPLAHYISTFSMEAAYQITKNILSQKPQYSLIHCATDNIALGAYKAVCEMALKIPQDISITGFGGYEFCEMLHPAMTTIALPFYETGQMAGYKINLMYQRLLEETFDTCSKILLDFESTSFAQYLGLDLNPPHQAEITLDSDHLFTNFSLKKHHSVDLKTHKS